MEVSETGHVIGATYMSRYWRKTYTVEAVGDSLGGTANGVRVLWQDGRVTVHCTHVGDDLLVQH